ncbi:Serine carboxypeptidase-like 17 [Platanthera zijinensis]|uniref:Serine carboxypeptidase-like 17 n=1 Tax=Platanthera zijinensis TaxID=2320716 RepID=A0AAP0BRN6_9ASPA
MLRSSSRSRCRRDRLCGYVDCLILRLTPSNRATGSDGEVRGGSAAKRVAINVRISYLFNSAVRRPWRLGDQELRTVSSSVPVQSVRGASEGTVKEWQVCNPELIYEDKIINSSIPYHHNVITKGYRALIFSGDHDLVVPYSGTLEWIASFNLSVIEPWRSWHVDGQVGGYTVRYSNNLTFATVKGGGHDSAKDRTKETWALFRRLGQSAIVARAGEPVSFAGELDEERSKAPKQDEGRNRGGPRCYRCNKLGHIRKDCRVNLQPRHAARKEEAESRADEGEWGSAFMTGTCVCALSSINYKDD